MVRSTIENFIVLCEKNYEIGKFYNFSMKKLEKVDIGENYKKINLLIDKLFLDLLTELNKTYINKKRYMCYYVHYIIFQEYIWEKIKKHYAI